MAAGKPAPTKPSQQPRPGHPPPDYTVKEYPQPKVKPKKGK